MEKLVTFLLFSFTFSTLKQTSHANNNCVDLRILNQQNDFLCVQVNHHINITFAIEWVHCSLSTSEQLIVKVVSNTSGLSDEECRLSVNKSTCRVSDNTPSCWCLSPTGPVTFSKRLTRAANITYVWQWYRGVVIKGKAVTVRVFEVSPTCVREDESPPPSFSLPGLVSGCVVFAVVVLMGVLFFIRKKVKESSASDLRSLQQGERTHTTRDFASHSGSDGKYHVTQYEDVWDAVQSQNYAGAHLTKPVEVTEWETNICSNS